MTEISTGVLTGVGQTFLVAAIGALGAFTGVIRTDTLRHLTRITIALLLPCFLFEAMFRDFTWSDIPDYSLMLTSAVFMLIIGMAGGALGGRLIGLSTQDRRTTMAMCMFNNSVNIPIPLAWALVAGAAAQKLVVLFTLYNLLWGFFIWSLGVWLVSPNAEAKGHLKKALLNPPVVAILAGIVSTLPGVRSALSHSVMTPIHNGLHWTGEAAIPMALIILGGILGHLVKRLRRINWRVISVVIVVKMLLVPLIALIAIHTIGAFEGLIALALMIQAASPPATNLILIAENWEGDTDTIGATLVVTYLLSIVTFVIWISALP